MKPTDEPQTHKQTNQPDTDDQSLSIDPEGNQRGDEVDEASDESFPASDPPSYTRSSTTKD